MQPIPVIKSLTDAGALTIAWDRKMQKPKNLEELPDSKVVVTDQSEADRIEESGRFKVKRGNRYRNLDKTREWFKTEKEYLEYLLVMDALDIELLSDSDEQTQTARFTWDLITYEKDYMDIQLHFDFSDAISVEGITGEISVTFWGT